MRREREEPPSESISSLVSLDSRYGTRAPCAQSRRDYSQEVAGCRKAPLVTCTSLLAAPPPPTCAPSASAAMTLPSMNSERLMLVVSRSVSPADRESRRRSLPARSTKETWGCRQVGGGARGTAQRYGRSRGAWGWEGQIHPMLGGSTDPTAPCRSVSSHTRGRLGAWECSLHTLLAGAGGAGAQSGGTHGTVQRRVGRGCAAATPIRQRQLRARRSSAIQPISPLCIGGPMLARTATSTRVHATHP